MNFATAATDGGGASGIDDAIDTKPQLLNFNNLNWPQQPTHQTANHDLLSASVAAASSAATANNNNTSPQSSSSNGGNNANSNNGDGGDAEGVWSQDIDQAFHEAMQIYPPCGRRKIILSDEGKMYGRNELIARYIKIRCGKTRTRKQVSSHIQVLARKKQREHHARIKGHRGDDHQQQAMTDLPAGLGVPQSAPSTSDSVSPNPPGAGGPDSVESSAGGGHSHQSLRFQSPAGAASADTSPAAGGNPPNPNGGVGVSSLLLSTTAPNAIKMLAAEAMPSSNNNTNNIGGNIRRDSIASSMHQKVLEAASAFSNNVMSSTPMHPSGTWPYPLNPQNILGTLNSQLGGISLPPNYYPSILGGLQLKAEQQHSVGVPSAAVPSAVPIVVPCHPSSSSGFSTHNFTIASSKLILCGFTAYIEQNLNGTEMAVDGEENRVEIVKIPKISDAPLERIALDCLQSKYPELLHELFTKGPADAFFLVKCWANMRFNFGDQQKSLFAVDSFFESTEKFDIIVSTKVCSFGNEVVEKVEIYSPIDEEEEAKCSGVWHFRLEKSPMCEYMVRFISELKKLQEPSLMNSVLENFTVLQIVSGKQSGDTLMAIAFMFEIREDGDDEISTNIYRITD